MRLEQIDFLRGIAVLLVMTFHYESFDWLNQNGWVGVDLFFVLSGFLVSSILFGEFIKFGNINAKQFLIRRSFRIYPLFFLLILFTVLYKWFMHQDLRADRVLYELTFMRNYCGGYWPHSWSLCVEEQFYIFIVFFLQFLIFRNRITDVKFTNAIFVSIFLFCLVARFMNFYAESVFGENYFFNEWARQVQTQYRIDSLLFGVFIAYNLHFNREALVKGFTKLKTPLLTISVLALICAFSVDKNSLIFSGVYTCLYFAFGNLLLMFILEEGMPEVLKKIFTPIGVKITAKIGTYSYAMYLFHPVLINLTGSLNLSWRPEIMFVLYLLANFVIGALATHYIERFFLSLRDKYFPARGKVVTHSRPELSNI